VEGTSFTTVGGRAERPPEGWRPSRPGLLALGAGLLVTAALALTALAVYNNNERRLLNLRVRELSLVLSAAAPGVQTPLASAAELADATGGNTKKFRAFMQPYTGAGRSYASVSLWPLGRAKLAPTAVIGPPPLLARMPSRARSLLEGSRPGAMTVTGFLTNPHPGLGFAFSAPAAGGGYAVYAESPLPPNRRSTLEKNSAFSDLNYALYLGRTQKTAAVLLTSEKSLPITGRKAVHTVSFGASVLTVVVTPNGSLGGAFFRDLPWLIVVVGALTALLAALLTDRLANRRRRAEELAQALDRVASENERLYKEQRGIAQTLQHALLPDRLPRVAGIAAGARYIPAARDIDVGGDWYDIVDPGEGRVLLVIGDVAGHGLRAATTMALLRHATLAYAAQDPAPSAVLGRLSAFAATLEQEHFATVLCVLLDTRSQHLTVASAGHMAPLLLNGGAAAYVSQHTGVPIGVSGGAYSEQTVQAPASGTLVAFTDGLVERRGEVIDVGLERLRTVAGRRPLPVDELLAELERELVSGDHRDDTAIVAMQWQS
jgi:serine phosphatase RsbU (regulator of sigma subunit)